MLNNHQGCRKDNTSTWQETQKWENIKDPEILSIVELSFKNLEAK